MPKKEVIQVNLAAANPNLSPATRFGDLVFVAGQTGRHPITGEVGRDVREQTQYAVVVARFRVGPRQLLDLTTQGVIKRIV
jgi:enamine deaminase RidA (YjgF/YER057c/UK114 family)